MVRLFCTTKVTKHPKESKSRTILHVFVIFAFFVVEYSDRLRRKVWTLECAPR